MSKIAYVGLPAHGHTNPTLPIMKQLVEHGHEVLYYNAASFAAKVRPTAVDFRPLPEPLPTEREMAEALHNFINASLMLSAISRPLTHFLVDELAREKPDIVIYDSAAMWGYVAAREKVYISLGTINHLDQAFYRTVFTAFAADPAQFILSIGRQSNLSVLGRVPDNFIVRNYVPQLDILARVDYFITHGGMNSVHEGLYYGVPEIVVPHQVEQLLNGKRVAEVKAGILLGDSRAHGRVQASELRQALHTLRHDPQYRENAARIGHTLREAGGIEQAVREIEAYLATALNR